ncbi:MAG TPA: hypothetical protein VFV67_20650 [Actinophytocola sp.]|uniref:hypothetical protein n=1 Tax=Actinophytocola sp. TaxID=1872138 RepID=UPI002DB7B3DD|nr:hypothetical protein [Actinophytocola sp.]HEU5473063.1 hypothetical protein [Actinophytocola sp.]
MVDTSPSQQTASTGEPTSPDEDLRVEPTVALEWAQALEQWGGERAAKPADARGAWLHRAPEHQVLTFYLAARAYDPNLPAPWWLRALAAGSIRSRVDGFAVEDRVAKLLASRPGWVYVPWVAEGDSGFWEYMPSERALTVPGVPTTLFLTHRHTGWLDVIPVHAGETPEPIPVQGPADLRANLARLESLRPA